MSEDLEVTGDALDSLAAALGLRRHQLCLRLGSLAAATLLAQRWAGGELTLDEVSAQVKKIGADPEIGSPCLARPRSAKPRPAAHRQD